MDEVHSRAVDGPGRRSPWASELLASVVVFLVALPLCMGIAIASGVPPALGLITGIVGGLVVGPLAGAPLQVSGPAAGLAVLVFELVGEHGLGALGPVVLVAGALQLAAGLLRVGTWFRAVSPGVILGLLSGIGVLIFAAQFHVMVDDRVPGGGLANLVSIPEAVAKGLYPFLAGPHQRAAAIGVLTILAIVGWGALAPGRLRVIPAPLTGVVVAVVAASALALDIAYVEVPANLLRELRLPGLADLSVLGDVRVLGAALGLAAIASAETLLCATAVDQMHHGPRTRYDRELVAQGVGNTLCGLLGALPLTGVIVRSSANVEAGARTRASAILHGVWILLLVTALPFVLELIPTAALAAVLVFTGVKLVNVGGWRRLGAQYGRSEVLVGLATVLGIVALDLLTGVVLGVVLSFANLVRSSSRLTIRQVFDRRGELACIHISGVASFVTLPKLASALESIPADTSIHVHTKGLVFIDSACLDLLQSFERRHAARGTHVVVEGWSELLARYRDAQQGEVAEPPRPATCLGLQVEPAAERPAPVGNEVSEADAAG